MSKTPFDRPARSTAKITRKAKKEKQKTFNKVFSTEFKFSHDALPLRIKARNHNHEAEYVRLKWPQPTHVQPPIKSSVDEAFEQLIKTMDDFIEAQHAHAKRELFRDLLALIPMLICVALLYLSSLFI